ncbi:hypothetical protein GCM10025875_30500 [Litorihabitans aurantiacus]|uniref:AAA+ ATPase domain-containing protein n=1 Tax=Litorihabitans aurantiacus TaxID=1930061 RepID=A0AA37XGB0_9MICO|nr:hypothetical protein GCM10025875_30500 [Litorihabitans aurantiacus]
MTTSAPGAPTPSSPAPGTPAAPAVPAVRGVGLRKTYGRGDAQVHALDGVDVAFARGEFTAIMGASGSGKSTLLHLLAGLDAASAGQVFLGDTELTALGDDALTRLRRQRVGFVFQSFNLLPMFTAEQNILLPLELAGVRATTDVRSWFDRLVDTLGLRQRLTHRPSELSGASSSASRSPARS